MIHKSQYEEEGWIQIDKELPMPGDRVKFSKIHIIDWNLESMEWETTGFINHTGLQILRQTKDKDIVLGSKATHWKKM
jgi:hypothetical protein